MAVVSLGTVLVAFAVSFAVGLLMERLAPRLGLVDRPGGRKIHAGPTPLGGGVAIGLGTFVPVAGGLALCGVLDSAGSAEGVLPFLHAHRAVVLERSRELLTLLCGGAAVVGLGLADDRWDLSAGLRLVAQGLVALGVFFAAPRLRITLFSASPVTQCVLTCLWFVVITNAFNLLDNMDGLSSGVALVASGLLFAAAVATGQLLVALFLLAFGGATAAFLARNFPPARIFAGSAGGYFLGFVLAASTGAFTFYERGRPLSAAAVPVLILAVALYDTASVLFIRLREKRPLLVGDRSHLSHRLVAMGMSRREAVLTIYLLGFCAGYPVLFLFDVRPQGALVFGEGLAVLALMAVLELAGKRRQGTDGAEPE